jgi:hypothetical protein
MLLAHILVLT